MAFLYGQVQLIQKKIYKNKRGNEIWIFLKERKKKLEEKNSKEKAFAFSFEKIEEELNSWIQRDKYSNKIINNIIDDLSKSNDLKVDSFLQIVNYTLNSLEKIVDNPKKKFFLLHNKLAQKDFYYSICYNISFTKF